MTYSTLDAGWKIVIQFTVSIFVVATILKISSIRRCRLNKTDPLRKVFLQSPLLALRSISRIQISAPILRRTLWTTTALSLAAILLVWNGYWWIIAKFQPAQWVVSYLAIPVIFLMGDLYGKVVQLSLLRTGYLIPPQHDHLFASRKLSEFWGSRWNIWVSDWFKECLFTPLKRRPVLAALIVFLMSGLFHETVINLPLYLVTGRILFGSMMVYFLLQALGILFERRFLRRSPRVNQAFMWLTVTLPAPLIMNEAVMRAFRLWPY